MEPALSLSMIVRNEESVLGNVLGDVVDLCDELVVVDTGSVDRTVEIAQSFGARVMHFDWIDDFAAARNYALDLCSGPWILWLDADDRVPAEAQAGFRSIIEELPRLDDIDILFLPYRYKFSATAPSCCISTLSRGRLFRNRPDLRWIGKIHEYVQAEGKRAASRTDAWVEHRPPIGHEKNSERRNLQVLERCIAEGDRSNRTMSYYAWTLASLDRHEEALDTFEALLSEPLEPDPDSRYGRYQMLCTAAASAAALGIEDQKLELLSRATVLDSERGEAFAELGKHFYEKREWRRAIPFFTAVTSLREPEYGQFNPMWYAWLPWDFLAVCESEIGDFEKALDFTLRALPGAPDRDRLIANIRLYAEHL
jgi:glycosyltransferase involved in cell wall biosynthesis